MSEEFLFVYGTLRRRADSEMYRFLARHASFVSEAHYQGKLYRIDHYPGVIASTSETDRVVGDVFRLPDPDIILPHMDRYEGIGGLCSEPYEYERCKDVVRLSDGKSVECWIYLYRHSLKGRDRIFDGDFCASAA